MTRKEMDSKNYICIDMRDKNKYKKGHLKGFINVPKKYLGYKKIKLHKNAKIIIYCDPKERQKINKKIKKHTKTKFYLSTMKGGEDKKRRKKNLYEKEK